MKIKQASEGKVWAYMENGQEIVLGSTLYLGKNDDGLRYYEVDDPSLKDKEKDIVINSANNGQ